MLHSIENEQLIIQANSVGAQLMSVYSKKTETEYLWQGSPAYWKDRAHNLFPFIGRMWDGIYHYDGQTYTSRAHGLARYFEFALESQTENSLTFLLTDNEETKKEYPFSFEFRVSFILNGAELATKYEVKNTDNREMICTFGGHPGINIPFGKGVFEDYYLDFGEAKTVTRQLLDATDSFMADVSVPFPLEDGKIMRLKHELFAHDAVILEDTTHYVAIRSTKDDRAVSMRYDDFKFIGIWQVNKPDTPYICLEPWSALPAKEGAVVDLETKPHMTRVASGDSKSVSFTLEIHE